MYSTPSFSRLSATGGGVSGRSLPLPSPFTASSSFQHGRVASPSLDVSNIYSIAGGMALTGQSASVLDAFRNLKAKAKALESEQREIKRDTEEMRSLLSQSRRDTFKFRRSPAEIQMSENMMQIRKESEEKRKQVNELERDLMILEDSHRSIERSITSSRARLAYLNDDNLQIHTTMKQNEQETAELVEDLQKFDDNTENMEKRVTALPKAKQLQRGKMKEAVFSIENDLQKVRSAVEQSKLRSAGLHRYIEMMIGVNQELCDTIMAREEAKARVMRIAEKMSPPSSSGMSQPKHNSKDVFASIAKRHSTSVLESETQKAVSDAKAVLKIHSALYADMLPKSAPVSSPSSRRSRHPSSAATTTTNDRKVRKVESKVKAKKRKSELNDLLTTDVEAIAAASKLFAERTLAAANISVTTQAQAHAQVAGSPTFQIPLSPAGHRQSPIDLALSGGEKIAPVFVPSGNAGRDNFNAYASVSRSVRAARHWNSQIASHVKSLEFGGAE